MRLALGARPETEAMTIAYYLVMTLHVIACLFLIAVVLLQQGKGQDLASAFGGGGTQTAFGPRGSANVLSRATTVLAGVFMVSSLALSMVKPRARSVLDTVPAPAPLASPSPVAGSPKPLAPTPAPPAPASPPGR
ncbi:MAG TPA: preprotein translocase subunit SecG [Vicinamibacteria bacterium]|nr:preprotein translocase subunit SecG [Vicinamibacteria bacterium]